MDKTAHSAKPSTLCASLKRSIQVQVINCNKSILLLLLLIFPFKGIAQVPSTKELIQNYIDSIGKSNDRQVITSSLFPSFADGKNFKWRIKIWRNSKKDLLWIETIIPDSISTTFFYSQDKLIFVAELTYFTDTILNRHTPFIRNIFFHQSSIIDDSAPGRNSNNADHYISESKDFMELSKKESLNLGIIELLNRGVIPDKKNVTHPNQ